MKERRRERQEERKSVISARRNQHRSKANRDDFAIVKSRLRTELTGSCKEDRPVIMCHSPRLDLPDKNETIHYSTIL